MNTLLKEPILIPRGTMKSIRIILADDHVVVRQGTRQLLEREPDFEIVGEADDGEEVVQLALKLKPDVVIMDVAMPKLSGIEATKQIKAVLPAITVLVLTGYDYDEYIFSMFRIIHRNSGHSRFFQFFIPGINLLKVIEMLSKIRDPLCIPLLSVEKYILLLQVHTASLELATPAHGINLWFEI